MALNAIGLEKFTFRVNSRKPMNELLEGTGVAKNQVTRTLRILDKLDKLSVEVVGKELRAFFHSNECEAFVDPRTSFVGSKNESGEFLLYEKAF